jgi:hypothetical protein
MDGGRRVEIVVRKSSLEEISWISNGDVKTAESCCAMKRQCDRQPTPVSGIGL